MVLSRDQREARRLQIAKDIATGMSVDLACRKYGVSEPTVYKACRDFTESTGEEIRTSKGKQTYSRNTRGTIQVTLVLVVPCTRFVQKFRGQEERTGYIDWTQRLEVIYHAVKDAGARVQSRLFGDWEPNPDELTSTNVPVDVLDRYKDLHCELEAQETKEIE